MGDRSFTLFELHFDRGINIGAGTPESDEPEAEEPAELEIAEKSKSDVANVGTAKKGVAALIVLGTIIAIVVAVKKLGGEPPQELEDVDELTEQF